MQRRSPRTAVGVVGAKREAAGDASAHSAHTSRRVCARAAAATARAVRPRALTCTTRRLRRRGRPIDALSPRLSPPRQAAQAPHRVKLSPVIVTFVRCEAAAAAAAAGEGEPGPHARASPNTRWQCLRWGEGEGSVPVVWNGARGRMDADCGRGAKGVGAYRARLLADRAARGRGGEPLEPLGHAASTWVREGLERKVERVERVRVRGSEGVTVG
eukprot:7023368-Prymnesium_polylepis.2